MKPIVGITSRLAIQDNRYVAMANYLNAVNWAGGIPLLLPVGDLESVGELIARVDGIIIPGGADVAPLYYGEQPHPKVGATCEGNDVFEVSLIREAMRCNKPVLGICRGIQVINVCFGGTLYQDIPAQTSNEICHYQNANSRGEVTHSATVKEDSILYGILHKGQVAVNSYHHQSVKGLGKGLRVSATAPDGVIEAVENADGSVIGIQWHPEALYATNEIHARLFTDHIARCSHK